MLSVTWRSRASAGVGSSVGLVGTVGLEHSYKCALGECSFGPGVHIQHKWDKNMTQPEALLGRPVVQGAMWSPRPLFDRRCNPSTYDSLSCCPISQDEQLKTTNRSIKEVVC